MQSWQFLLLWLDFIMVYDMEWGPWAFSDSAAYISAARNLVSGNGLTVPTPDGGLSPLRLHQPLYPLVMSFFLLFDIHPFTTTTVLNVASFSLSILLFGCGSYYFSKSKIFTLVIVFLMTWCPFVIENYDGAMSEPLYLFLTLLNFMVVLLFLEKRKNWMLLLAALAAGLSILTRYIGIVNVVGGALMVFVFLNEKTKNRVITAIFYSFHVLGFAHHLASLFGNILRDWKPPAHFSAKLTHRYWQFLPSHHHSFRRLVALAQELANHG